MFYKIPADRTGMSSAELRTHLIAGRTSLRDAARATDKPTKEEFEAYRAELDSLADEVKDQKQIEVDEAEKAADDAAAQAAADKAAQASDDGAGDGGDKVEGDVVEGDKVVTPPPAPAEPAGDDAGKASAKAPAVVRTSTELAADEVTPEPRRPITVDQILASTSTDREPGDPFASWGEFGMAAVERAKTIAPNSTEQYQLGVIRGNYPKDKQLGLDPFENLKRLDSLTGFERSAEEITASLCAPATPYYGMSCLNTTRRPVAASLDGFEAPRGKVSIYPSPTLANVAGSAGIWTAANDANLSATKNACARITCATSTEFTMYGVYWCLTVKNMELLTFPELVAAYMNRGAANFARLGERQLLDAMGSGVASVTTLDLGPQSAIGRVATQLLQYLALYREQQRWDDVPMQAWAPRWFRDALRVDMTRRNRADGSFRLATIGEVDAVFRDAGFDMTWYIDTPTWGTPIPNLTANPNLSAGVSAQLSAFPVTAEVLVAPAGKFRMIDRAQIAIGVTGNNWYRDNTSNSKNEVTYFFENYEGVVDTTSCPAHLIKFDTLCYNGAQVADRAFACTGVAS